MKFQPNPTKPSLQVLAILGEGIATPPPPRPTRSANLKGAKGGGRTLAPVLPPTSRPTAEQVASMKARRAEAERKAAERARAGAQKGGDKGADAKQALVRIPGFRNAKVQCPQLETSAIEHQTFSAMKCTSLLILSNVERSLEPHLTNTELSKP